MVLIHGGAFVSGSRTSDGEPDVAFALARRGYLCVSIDYRLTGSFWGAGPDREDRKSTRLNSRHW